MTALATIQADEAEAFERIAHDCFRRDAGAVRTGCGRTNATKALLSDGEELVDSRNVMAVRLARVNYEIGDPIPSVFPPQDPTARFVVSMAMAKNDIERALRDVQDAIENDRPDFYYRARLSMGHLVEALAALNSYSQDYAEVRALINRMPAAAKKHLKVARGSLQKAGQDVLRRARDNTFHYPSARSNYSPTSDAQLGQALADLAGRGVEMHLDGDTQQVTFTFADDIALALAMGSVKPTELESRAGPPLPGASFVVWVSALVATYQDENDITLGQPLVRPKPTKEDRA